MPQFSSHQFSLTIKSELSDIIKVEAESNRLYTLLQGNVDEDIQKVGFLPGNASNGHAKAAATKPSDEDAWKCSPKQKDLILKIVVENKLDKKEIEALTKARFNTPVKELNKMQASGLIQELIEKYCWLSNESDSFSNYRN